MNFLLFILLYPIFSYSQDIFLTQNINGLEEQNKFMSWSKKFFRNLTTCYILCQTCDGPYQNNCSSCDISNNLIQSANTLTFECICQQGYYLNANTCSKCDLSCKSCNGGTDQDCIECQSNRILTDGYCVCPSMFYEDNQGQCLPCIINCMSCNSNQPLQCQQCSQNRIFQNSTCQCIQGFYENNNTCIQCNSLCQVCAISQNTGCDQCIANSSLQNSQCVCNQTFFYNNSTQQCEKCDPTCLNCSGPNPNQCLSCFSLNSQLDLGICTCNSGYYQDSNFQCQKCYSACSSCSGSQSHQCIGCVQNRYLLNGTCTCIDGYYEDGSSALCQQCQYSCSTCSNGTINGCLNCQQNRQLIGFGLCKCIDGYFEDTTNKRCSQCDYSCQTCSNASKTGCIQCQIGRQKLSDGSCVCNQGFYEDSNLQTCQQCQYSCQTCTGGSSSDCLSCQQNRTLQGNSCQCNQGFYDDFTQKTCSACYYSCLSCQNSLVDGCLTCKQNRSIKNGKCNCKKGYYEDSQSLICQKCHFSCSKCSNGSATDCLACVSNRQLQGSTCVCVDGYFEDIPNKICTQCDYSCSTCINSSKNGCLTCQNNRTKQSDNTCLCNDGFYEDSNQMQCSPCHYSCQTCTDGSPNSCLTCQTNRTKQGNVCTCNQGFYDDNQQNACIACHYSCQNCKNSSANGCNTCKQNRTLNASSICPCNNGFYDDQLAQDCLPCQYSCLTCTTGSSSSCASCQTNRFFQSGKCICQPGFFEDIQNQKCSPCHYSCQTCIDASTNSCTSCEQTRSLTNSIQSLCICKQGYYDIPQNSQCQLCNPKCLNCVGPQSNMCTQCDSQKNFTPSNSQASQFSCICTSNSYYDPINITCLLCNQKCATCTGPQQTQCLSCSSLLYRVLIGSSCQCMQGYFENVKGQCQPCHSSCYNCIGPTKFQCSECDPFFNRFYNQIYSTCDCIKGFYDTLQPFQTGQLATQSCLKCDNLCSNCVQSNLCVTCINNLILVNQKCQCPQGYYLDIQSNFCFECYYTCQDCVGPNQVDCLTCKQQMIQTPSYYQTISPFNQLFGCSCQNSNPVNNCINCHYSCKPDSCNPDQPNICLDCKTNRQLISQKTISGQIDLICICNKGFYEDEITQECKPCNPACDTCLGPSETNCITCNQDRIIEFQSSLINGRCLCKKGYFENYQTRSCQACNYFCASCAGNSSFCTECKQNAFLDSLGNCNCKPQYYLSTEGDCQRCHYSCQNCIGGTESDCLQCSSQTRNQVRLQFQPYQSTCYCKQGYFDEGNSQCQQCSPQCMTCKYSSNFCLECYPEEISKRVLISNQCVCKPGFQEDKNGLCVQCPYDCLSCENNGNCLTCINDLRILNQSTKRCSCKEGYYEDVNTSCKKCDYRCKNCSQNSSTCSECHPNSSLNSHLSCICNNGFYALVPSQDQENNIPEIPFQMCQKCLYNCNTCENNNSCTSCLLSNSDVYLNADTKLCDCYFGYEMKVDLSANTFQCIKLDNYIIKSSESQIQNDLNKILKIIIYIFNIMQIFSMLLGSFLVSDLGFQTYFDIQLLLYYNGMKLNLIIEFLEPIEKYSIFKLINIINPFQNITKEENYLSVYLRSYNIQTNIYKISGGFILLWAVIQIACLILSKTIFHKRYVLLDQAYKISKGRIFLSNLFNKHLKLIYISISNALTYYLLFALILGIKDPNLNIYLPSYFILAFLIIIQLRNIIKAKQYFLDPLLIFEADIKMKDRYIISIIQLLISCISFQMIADMSNLFYLTFILSFKIIYALINIYKLKGKIYYFEITIFIEFTTILSYLFFLIITYLTQEKYLSQSRQNLILLLCLLLKITIITLFLSIQLYFIFDISLQLYTRKKQSLDQDKILQIVQLKKKNASSSQKNINTSALSVMISKYNILNYLKQNQLNWSNNGFNDSVLIQKQYLKTSNQVKFN